MGQKRRAPRKAPLKKHTLKSLAKYLDQSFDLDSDVPIRKVQNDSRHIKRGDVFVCVRGIEQDGHDFAQAAKARGAKSLIVERPVDVDLPQLVVDDSAKVLGLCESLLAGEPSSHLEVMGITGTNGKTTTSFILEAILREAARSPGVIGTVNYRYGGRIYPAPYTTPTPSILQSTLASMVKAKATHAIVEVSSAALEMKRLYGTKIQVAGFTNLSQDHLDVHHSMAAYQRAKSLLFSAHLEEGGTAVIHMDSPASEAMVRAAGARRILRVTSTNRQHFDIRVRRKACDVTGIRALFDTPSGPIDIHCASLLGDFNIDNIGVAIGMAQALGIDTTSIAQGIEILSGVPGRLERVVNAKELDVFVDYAHTPDALENVLSSLRPLTRKNLWVVFGAGGDRDRTKRAPMGKIAATLADRQCVTSDNPRSEDPNSIIRDVLQGLPDPTLSIADRELAIHTTLAQATPQDVVVIAGKGHETYQVLRDRTITFDDRIVASHACDARTTIHVETLADDAGAVLKRMGDEKIVSRVIIDGRDAAPGDVYVAIAGEHHDGHKFCEQAYQAGVRTFLVSEPVPALEHRFDASVLFCENTRESLGHVARQHRVRWGGQVVGVTGSAGKTTTVQLIASMLSHGHHAHRTRGSMNNETGVPLTLLGTLPLHQFAVVEMGMRGLGQITYLSDMALPDVSVVTNAGSAHVGVVGSLEAIAQAKSEIYQALDPKRGVAIYPDDHPILAKAARAQANAISFGWTKQSDVQIESFKLAEDASARVRIRAMGRTIEFPFHLLGRHNAQNAACALAVACALGIDLDDAAAGLSTARPPNLRGEVQSVHKRRLLVDCYNSNPDALRSALRTLKEMSEQSGARAIAMIGDMLELGPESEQAHHAIGELAAALDITLVAMGEFAPSLRAGYGASPKAHEVHTPFEAAQALIDVSDKGDWILVKGSRGMRLERVVQALVSMR